jgi:hypothetical protein
MTQRNDPAARQRGRAEVREKIWTSDNTKRSARRQHLSRHLHAAGPRPCMEALIEVADGGDLDTVLESYARIAVEVYRALGADELPMERLHVIDGGAK